MKQTETQIVRACLDYLHYKKIFCWRSNSGAVTAEYKGKKRFVRFAGVSGLSDIIGVLPSGIFIAIEVKRPGFEATDEQEAFLTEVRKRGGLAIVVHSVDELDTYLNLPF